MARCCSAAASRGLTCSGAAAALQSTLQLISRHLRMGQCVCLAGSCMVPLGGAGRLEDKLRAAAGPEWRRHLGADAARPNGSPSVLLIAPSAAGANDLIKQLPALHQARLQLNTSHVPAVYC